MFPECEPPRTTFGAPIITSIPASCERRAASAEVGNSAMATLSLIDSFKVFDLIWVTTKGGPVDASNTMATYLVEQGFERFQLGYGSAIAVILFGISLVVALAYQRLVLRRDLDGAMTGGAA